jgi:beta-phosphoglucomutase-like phosphatase (HAD superfamily)
MPVAALAFDYNGTLSQDEPLLFEIFGELFAEQGRPLDEAAYFGRLAGLSDPEIVSTWLGPGHRACDEVVARRTRLYLERAGDGSTIPVHVREAVREAARRVPLAVVSGALRAEVEAALEAAGLLALFAAVVTSEDVGDRGKPDPAPYRLALERLGSPAPASVVVFEDAEAGIAAALAAGCRCVAVEGTLPVARLAAAERVVPALDRAAVLAALS